MFNTKRFMNAAAWMLVVVLIGSASAVAATIGTITSNGRFQMNGSEVWNQAALMEGSAVQTGSSATRLLLRNGTDVRIGSVSSGRVFANRMILDNGSLEGLLARSFRLETALLGLRVEGDNARAHVRVSDGSILVASLQGAVQVRGSQGILLASLSEGNAVELSATEEGTTVGTRLTGVIQNKNHRYFLKDEVTGVTVELKGEQPSKHAGKRVTIQGDIDSAAAPGGNAEYVVRVTRVESPTGTAASAGAGQAGAGDGGASGDKTSGGNTSGGGASGGGAGAGLSTGTKVGIIAGVAVAGATTTGLVVAGNGEEPASVSP